MKELKKGEAVMYRKEDKTVKKTVEINGEDEFQIRYIHSEDVGIITSRSDKSYFILDSKDYWYDLTQEKYPSKKKCSCKNDYFKLSLDYTLRDGESEVQSVELYSQCTQCGRGRPFAKIKIDYSPSLHLLKQPFPSCTQPKIKCRMYSISGFWKRGEILLLTEYLSDRHPFIYLWYWEAGKRELKQVNYTELTDFLSDRDSRYLDIYFSLEPLNCLGDSYGADGKGIYIDGGIYRKRELVRLSAPIPVMGDKGGNLYCMDFCGEYIDTDGSVKSKSEAFVRITNDLLSYVKAKLK